MAGNAVYDFASGTWTLSYRARRVAAQRGSTQQSGVQKRTVDSGQVFGGVAGVLSLLGSWVGVVGDQLTVPLVTGVVLVLIGAFLLYRWGGGARKGSPVGFVVPVLVTVLGAATAGAAVAARSAGGTAPAAAATTSSGSAPTSAAPTS